MRDYGKYYVYIYWETSDKPFYVGKGRGHRANVHIRNIGSCNKRVVTHIDNLRSKGIEPKLDIIHTTNETAAFWMERMLIAAYGRKDLGTGSLMNLTDGGDGCSGFNMPPEAKQKISKALSGRKFTQEHRDNISKSKMNSVPSEETRRKLAEASKGKRHTPETIAKLSEMKKGQRHTVQTRMKLSNSHKGKTLSESTKQRMSEVRVGRVLSDYHRKRIAEGLKGKKKSLEHRMKISEAAKKRYIKQ